jgi:two-component system, NarL family, nitrate/nitrite response regulator NarL
VKAPGANVRGMIRVFIVAEVNLYREGLADALGRRDGISVVGTAASTPDALAEMVQLRPDIVLLEVGPSGPEALALAAAALPGIKIVALAIRELEQDVIACVEAGACAYVTRDASIDHLVRMLECVARGEAICPPHIVGSVLRRLTALAATRPTGRRHHGLTHRELEVVVLIDGGLSNKQIASRLHVELSTVKNHVHHILEKLEVRRRVDAPARLREILPPPRPTLRD